MSGPDQTRAQASSRGQSITPAGLVAGKFVGDQGRSAVIALIVTVVLHIGVVLVMPENLTRKEAFETNREVRLEVILEETEPPPEAFVLANPEAVSNPPDETRFFSDRNQQAAQEEEADQGDPSLPSIDGEEPEANQNIVNSDTAIFSLEEEMAGGGAGEDGEELAFNSLPERLIPGFETTDEADGLEVPVTSETDTPLEENPVFGVDLGEGEETREEVVEETATYEPEGEEQIRPRPRPALSQISRGPVGSREGAATRVGQVAVDAQFSEYGDYLARMIDVIVRQWHILAWDSLQAGEVGTVVTISFRIDASGQIHGLEVLNSTASLIATLICQDAIGSRQPYGVWTADMRQVLGEEQTIRMRFLYR